VPEPRVAIAYDCFFPTNGGGGERVYRRIAEEFAERGSHVTYVTRSQWATDAAPRTSFDIAGVWRGEIYDDRGTRTSTSALAFAFALFRHFLRHRGEYDLVVVAALPVLNVFAVRIALLGRQTRIVVDWLEVWSWRKWRHYAGALKGTVAAVLQWVALQSDDLLTVNSDFTRARVRRYRRRADPIVLGLLDLVGVDPAAAIDAPSEPTLLFVGRHIPDKRLDALPGAMVEARKRLPNLTARVVGTGPETQRVRQLAVNEGLSGAVSFLGRVDEETLRRLFAESSALVNPSAREGFGLVVAEAAAAATPSVVVSGEDNAATELIVPGVNGFVAADASAPALAAAIVAAVTGGAELRRSTIAWFRREREQRSIHHSVDELLRRYEASRARSND
jgi:glycosyltransferase involved in cell wall biosynthesis